MNEILLIGLAICLCYGIESIFGLGGTVLLLAVLAFFFDIKDIVSIAIFTAIIASTFVLFSDKKSFNKKLFLKTLLLALPGLLLGTFMLKSFTSPLVLKIFAAFLVFYAVWTIFLSSFLIPKVLKPIVTFFAGIFGGMLGAPGPLLVIAMRDRFAHKSEMRTTLAGLFIILAIIRIPIYLYDGILKTDFILPLWWIIFPLFLTVWIGHKIHVGISERAFQIGVSILLGIAGISLFI
jgi:uncharacterized membrane protein YfcA